MAARMVLKDWNKGKIPYYSVPPTDSGMTVDGSGCDAKIVSKFSEEFDINKILAAHDAELMEGLEEKDEMDFVQVNSVSVNEGKDASKMLNYLTKQGGDEDDSNEDSDHADDMDEDDGIVANSRMADAEDFDFDS